MNNSTTATREALFKDINALKRDTTQVVQDVKKHANAHVDETKKRVNDTFVFLQEQASAHPFALLGAGFVLGYLLAFRRRA